MRKAFLILFILCLGFLTLALNQTSVNGELLMDAAYYHRIEEVKRLIEEGVEVNFTSSTGATALINALQCPNYLDRPQAIKNHLQVIEELIDAGADVNAAITSRPFPNSLLIGQTPLMEAAQSCNSEMLTLLLEAGANVNATNEFGDTALLQVNEFDNTKVKVLLEAGANINVENRFRQTALGKAIVSYVRPYNDSTERIELLLQYGADPNFSSPLLDIVEFGFVYEKSSNVFHMLIQAGAKIPGAFIALIAKYPETLPLVEEAIRLGGNVNGYYFDETGTALSRASTPAIVRVLVEAGADVKNQGEQALSNAVNNYDPPSNLRRDYRGVIHELLNAGADINSMIERYKPLRYKIPLITYAIAKKEGELLDSLLAMDVDVNKRDSFGRTPLFWLGLKDDGCAAQDVDLEVLKKLLEVGVDVNARGTNHPKFNWFCPAEFFSDTPLQQAVKRGDTESVKLLVNYSADLSLQDSSGWTALDFAVQTGQEEIIKLLLEASQQ